VWGDCFAIIHMVSCVRSSRCFRSLRCLHICLSDFLV